MGLTFWKQQGLAPKIIVGLKQDAATPYLLYPTVGM
jgi:hypothetical protein